MDVEKSKQVDYDEEYVLFDLDDVCMQADIAGNVPYVISKIFRREGRKRATYPELFGEAEIAKVKFVEELEAAEARGTMP
ncbi:hypothetical protein AXF42_Ash010008 [Apostasia shenzhenica]|uniref:Uncharacterized protein n=1 Tax=Apostasia shenzhenica TaxID=1088818 RepID=A0A2I0ACK1_9ASPA|nr:hypothetical protein AXF42_Ash010008 [Apostasia shenzhenica]